MGPCCDMGKCVADKNKFTSPPFQTCKDSSFCDPRMPCCSNGACTSDKTKCTPTPPPTCKDSSTCGPEMPCCFNGACLAATKEFVRLTRANALLLLKTRAATRRYGTKAHLTSVNHSSLDGASKMRRTVSSAQVSGATPAKLTLLFISNDIKS